MDVYERLSRMDALLSKQQEILDEIDKTLKQMIERSKKREEDYYKMIGKMEVEQQIIEARILEFISK